jgi:hypothetical protein
VRAVARYMDLSGAFTSFKFERSTLHSR